MTPKSTHKPSTPDLPILSFETCSQWREWLVHNHSQQDGIWLRLYKKGSGIKSITHEEALDEALCFGWIDALGKSYDSQSWILKFTPRRAKSMWSKRNRDNVVRLIQEKRMTEFGKKEIEKAKKDGRWNAAYDSPKHMVAPDDFLALLSTDTDAEAFYKTLNKANTYAILWRLQTAKTPQVRTKRLHALFNMMKARKKLH